MCLFIHMARVGMLRHLCVNPHGSNPGHPGLMLQVPGPHATVRELPCRLKCQTGWSCDRAKLQSGISEPSRITYLDSLRRISF